MEKYNLPHEEVKRFEVYYGRNVEQMPKLRADGRTPMSTAQLMQRRLELREDTSGVKDFFMGNYFDTGDAVAYSPTGDVKIVLDSQTLREMTPKSLITPQGALVLTHEAYNALQGEEFKKGKLGKVDVWMSREAVKAHPVWKLLARNQALLNEYTDLIFKEGEYTEAMGIFPSSCKGTAPEMRAWYVRGLGNSSNAVGRCGLVNVIGRLVGSLAPEAQGARGNSPVSQLEASVSTALNAKDSFVYNGTLYVPVAKTAKISA